MSIKVHIAAAALLLLATAAKAQLSINTTGAAPNASAMLDVRDTSRGVLLPRMTLAQRNAITSPATGLLIYQTNNTPGFYYNSGTAASPVWTAVSGSSGGGSGTTDYIPRFSGTGLTDSRLIDSDEGLFYNTPVNTTATMWFTSPANTSNFSNWFLHEGNTNGYTFLGAIDNTPNNKGFLMGQKDDLLNGTSNIGAIYFDPASTSMNFGNSYGPLYGINLNDGRMGHNNNSNAHFYINSPYDTAALFTSNSPNVLTYGIVRAEYTGTTVDDHLAIVGRSRPDLNADKGIGIRGDGGWIGVMGLAKCSSTGSLLSTGVYGEAYTNGTAIGVNAIAGSLNGTTAGVKYGLKATATGGTTNYAGYFTGNVQIIGSLAKSSGTFKIDHPQDPENKYLYHSFVESPDMMNIYNGNITTDAAGFATVTLPAYFEALNKDFRYQLTVIGSFAQAMVKEKVDGNKFVIQTNQPGIEVSWQVTGIRQDPYANAHRVQPEVAKEPENRGKYLNPVEWGKPETAGADYELMHTMEKRKAQQPRTRVPQSLPKPTGHNNLLGKPVKK